MENDKEWHQGINVSVDGKVYPAKSAHYHYHIPADGEIIMNASDQFRMTLQKFADEVAASMRRYLLLTKSPEPGAARIYRSVRRPYGRQRRNR